MSCFNRAYLQRVHVVYPFVIGLSLSFLLLSCGSTEEQKNSPKLPYQVNLVEAYRQNSQVPLSRFAKSVEYIKLESSEEALIGQFPHFYLFGDYLICIAFRQVYVFDRKSGDFIEELRGYGQGPDEYRSTRSRIHADEERGVVYVRDNRNIELGLNVKGETALRFKGPEGDEHYVTNYAQLNDDLFVGFHPNTLCDQDIKLVIFNKVGKVIKTFTNHLQCENYDPNRLYFSSSEGTFYHWNGQVGFKETYNDTLFIVKTDSLSTKAVFNSGEYGLPYEEKKKLQGEGTENYHVITQIDETDNQIFFNLYFRENRHSGFYDKQTGETLISRTRDAENHLFINDLDNFLPFNPLYATGQGELVGFIEAPEVLNWLDENPEKAQALPNSLRELTKLSDDDNPIVMIVKLKD